MSVVPSRYWAPESPRGGVQCGQIGRRVPRRGGGGNSGD